MLWTHEAQLNESTTNFDHCDEAFLLSIRVQTMLNTIQCVFYHNVNIAENVFSEHKLKKALIDTLTRAALSGLLLAMVN